MPKINILKENEIILFDSPPQFSQEKRIQYFILPEDEIKFRKIETKIGYILQEGYFRSRQKFFLPDQYHKEDVEYVSKLCGVKRKIIIKDYYNRAIHNVHRQFILKKYGYNSFSDYRPLFEKEAQELVKSSSKPEEIFYTLVEFLVESKIEVPKYYIFAEAITKSLNLFENELIESIDKVLTSQQKDL